MLEILTGPFAEFLFMKRALLGTLMLSISTAPIGVFLMLRRMSLTGDAMSHAILPGAAIGFLFAGLSVTAMTIGGLIAGSLVVLLSGVAARQTDTAEDSSLAAFYLTSLAIGVMIISMSGSNVDLMNVLFGSTLALDNTALILLFIICAITLLTLAVFYRPLVMECIDADFLKSISRYGAAAHYGFLILVVLNLVSGFHAMGTLMSVGLMILPATVARFWVKQLEPLILLSVLLAFIACVSGLLFSYYVSVPTSPTIITSLGAAYFVSVLFGLNNGIVTQWLIRTRKHLSA
ncbi:metal ABC transporter permease [Reinekea marinisedimentorum]|uniref:Zinc/manganese transport system permease protein n=1 Tax=Reinekea marinisedimentorum TaxID=230495 RepID=A0A4R3ICZ2_9GAMM|nr:metal ABC transporter permease [Reinekea marinisedimentorum]TCS42505.1 zinc/manganese transport system permease protein [Reinekea marinisedimentorum]